jgi:hypothetical protein
LPNFYFPLESSKNKIKTVSRTARRNINDRGWLFQGFLYLVSRLSLTEDYTKPGIVVDCSGMIHAEEQLFDFVKLSQAAARLAYPLACVCTSRQNR